MDEVTDDEVREYLRWIDACYAKRWAVSYEERMTPRAGQRRAWDEGLEKHGADGWLQVTEKGRAFLGA